MFWLQSSNKNSEEPSTSNKPVKIEVPSELPKIGNVAKFQQKLFVIENDRLLDKIISQDIVNIVLNSPIVICDSEKKNDDSVGICNKCLEIEAEFVKRNDVYIELSKRFSNLEQHCISLESETNMDEIETINIELEHSVAKLLFENKLLHKEIKHLKNIYKDQFDSIKKTCACAKEESDSLIAQLNSKSMENTDLEGQIQEKAFVTTALQNELIRLKGKNMLDNATTIAPGMFKLDIEPISHRLKNNMDAHEDYLKKTIENTNTIHGLIERARKQNRSEPILDTACMFMKHVHELLVYVVQIVLWYSDSGCSKHMTRNRSQLTNFVNKFHGTVKFGNDQIAKIMGYGDYQIGNVTISRVYYVEGLGYNLFSVGQLCDSNLEVAFRKHTCFVRNLKGVDLLTGSRGTNLYTFSIGDMMKSSSICLLTKAAKTKSWLWH
ncbi:hypothetical protein Tco_0064690 [Tanacetum coccineum]